MTTVTALPTVIHNPPASGNPHATIINRGASIVYLGQSTVTPLNGLPLYPGNSFTLVNAPVTLYAVSAYTVTATTTTTTAAIAAAGTSLAVTSGTGLTTNSYILVGSTTGSSEVTQITAGGGTTTLTVTAMKYDHASGSTVTLITATTTPVDVARGTS